MKPTPTNAQILSTLQDYELVVLQERLQEINSCFGTTYTPEDYPHLHGWRQVTMILPPDFWDKF